MENVARELPAMYADGIAMPAGTCTPDQRQTGHCRFLDTVNGFGSNRPSPRNVSNELFRQVQRNCALFLINYDGSIVPLTGLSIYRHFALYCYLVILCTTVRPLLLACVLLQIESKISSRRLSDLHSHFGQVLGSLIYISVCNWPVCLSFGFVVFFGYLCKSGSHN